MKILIVGSGFYGSIMAYLYQRSGHKVEVIEKRNHIGGNAFTSNNRGIHVHEYGPHIFHTNDEKVWNWICRFVEFNDFTLRPFTLSDGELYSLPFNMLTFNKLWGVVSPSEAEKIIESQKFKGKINNLEEQALALVGHDVYEKLIKGYTKKQWKKHPRDLPSSIIRRLPVRFTYDNNYFNDKFQGIPVGGYTQIFSTLLQEVKVTKNTDFFDLDNSDYDKIIYTGPIDKYFNYRFGKLEYRSLNWRHRYLDQDNVQGIAMLNRADEDVEYTRTIEHKHFDEISAERGFSIVTEEYPADYVEGQNEPLYPINDDRNNEIFKQYRALSLKEDRVHFGGRLARYKYYDMHQVIASAIHDFANMELEGDKNAAFEL